MRESALQRPDLIQTAMGGKRMAIRPRKMSPADMVASRRLIFEKVVLSAQCESWIGRVVCS